MQNRTSPMRSSKSAVAFALLTTALPLVFPVSHGQYRALNYDTPSYIEVEAGELVAREDRKTISVTLFRTGEFRVITRVDYLTIERTASGGRDYKAAGGTVVFQAGEGFKKITLELLPDSEVEEDETFELKLSARSEQVIITRDLATITIQDAPATPRLNITPARDRQIRLSWTGSSNAILERAADPASSEWHALPCQVNASGEECEVIEPADGQLFFYRLRNP